MRNSETALSAEISKVEALIAQFDEKEKELIAIGGDYMIKLSLQAGTLGQKIAQTRGSNHATLIGVASGLATMAAIGVYQAFQSHALTQKRKEFAQNNIDKLEELGHILQREGQAAINFLTIQEDKGVLKLDQNTLKGYSPVFKSLVKYQNAVYRLIERDHTFRRYYTHFADWTEREPNPALLIPFIDSNDWLEKRLINAEATTQHSNSLTYNFSLQGHLLLFLTPNTESPLGKRLNNFIFKASYLFENEFQRSKALTPYQQSEYISETKDLLGDSQLKKKIDEKYLQVERRLSLYENRHWIIFGMVLIVIFISLIIIAIIGG